MFGRRPKNRPIQPAAMSEPAWPRGVPRLYPNLSDRELSEFLPEDLYLNALRFPRVQVLPFGSANRSVREQLVGMGLSRLLIRDLMLVRNLSIRGPEDTPDDFVPDPANLPPGDFRADVLITGQVVMEQGGLFSARMWIHQPPEAPVTVAVPAGDVLALTDGCRREIVRVLEGHINPLVEERWQTGRPASFEALQDFGQLSLAKDDPARGHQALELWKRDPGFVLPLHLASESSLGQPYLVRGIESDPHDAQLYFLLFLAHWESRGPQPEAVQFLRRAIILSPGHGKAHMCAPHAADENVSMLRHSELGYRLLPGNPFAINNYILYLQKAGETQELKRLALEGLETDPHDHSSYDRLMEIHEAEGDYQQALHYARLLLKLYEPTIHPRTYQCLQQNPQRADRLADGWEPAEDVKRTIRRLSRMAIGENVELVRLTQAAADELQQSLRRDRMPEGTRIRVTALGGQDGEVSYHLDFDEEIYDPTIEFEFESRGVLLVVGRKQVAYLDGTVLDYQPQRVRQCFLFDNPNE